MVKTPPRFLKSKDPVPSTKMPTAKCGLRLND